MAVGTKVTWINRDDVPHTVTSQSAAFASQALDTDQQFSFHFTTPGSYAYYCAIHPVMTAEIGGESRISPARGCQRP